MATIPKSTIDLILNLFFLVLDEAIFFIFETQLIYPAILDCCTKLKVSALRQSQIFTSFSLDFLHYNLT